GMAGAQAMLPKKNVLVINAGTCITYDVVTSDGAYFGGNITPGAEMRLKALNTFTDRLPLIRKQLSNELFGRSTSSAILTGVVRGSYYEISGFISDYHKKYKGLNVILTGGDAPFFESIMETKIFAPNLVLYGLNKILSLNE
nr:type III pantothenate kinase [Chitinophagales bacterium]